MRYQVFVEKGYNLDIILITGVIKNILVMVLEHIPMIKNIGIGM